MAREAGAVRVIFVSCSPECIYPHIVSATTTPWPHISFDLAITASSPVGSRSSRPHRPARRYSSAKLGGPAFPILAVQRTFSICVVCALLFGRRADSLLSKYGIDLADPAGEKSQTSLILTSRGKPSLLSRPPVPQGNEILC